MIQVLGALMLWLPCVPSLGHAQVPPITPSGLNTQVNLSALPPAGKVQYDITGGTRPGGGVNLFHSFGNFNVPTNNIANFLNGVSFDVNGNPLAAGLPTSNILGRVTGGNPSTIFGTIQTTGFGNANLFLMNPTGFLFGPNATVNVGGMVAFTTADYLRLAAGVLFNATSNAAADALLSAAPVAAFGFLGSNPAAIAVQGSTVAVQPGQSISFVGGNQGFTYTNPDTGSTASVPNGVTVTGGQLLAPGGQVNIASVASPGEMLAGTLAQAPNINGQSFGALGTIQISQQSLIDVSANGGGTVLIRGGQFVLDNSTISINVTGPGVGPPGAGIDIVVNQDAVIQNGAILQTSVSGDATPGVQYGGVHVQADRIEIIGSEDIVNFPLTGIISDVAPDSTVKGGDIKLEANSILVKDLGTGTTLVETTTLGNGSAGKISLRTGENLEIAGGTIDSFAVFGSGHAGDIELRSTQGNILMTNHTFVSSQASPFSTGNSGAIVMGAPGGDILLADMTQISNAARGTGALGGIEIDANNLTLLNSGISGDNLTTNPAGNITVTLSGTLNVGGTGFNSFIQTISRGPAPAADLDVMAKGIVITDGARLSTETFSSGPGGHLNISTDNLQLTNGGQVRSGSTILPPDPGGPPPDIPSGRGGTITIQGLASPAESVLIDGAGSGIFTDTQGTGAGGNIFVNANSVTLQSGGTLSAKTSGTDATATGGTITVNATNQVTMTGRASITASSTGPGNAGNISINVGQQFEIRDSSVKTEAAQASGGNIDIQAVDSVRLVNSSISTSVLGGSGSGGNITIDPNIVVLQNSQVIAQAVQGAGGNITITTPLFLADSTSLVSASSQFGLNGTVTIQSPTSNLSESLGPLASKPNQAQSLLTQRCAALANGQASSFVVAGREQLPADPGSWLTSPLAFTALGENLGAGYAVASTPAIVAIAAHDTDTVSLRRLTPAGFLIANFADSEATGCHS
jgi:filamentous hemagglutinin family protein